MMVVTVIVLFNRALDFFVFKSRTAADVIEGKTVELVRNGINAPQIGRILGAVAVPRGRPSKALYLSFSEFKLDVCNGKHRAKSFDAMS